MTDRSNEPLSAEAAALHAVIEGDLIEARQRINDMLPGERMTLRRNCGQLISLLELAALGRPT